MKVAYVDTSCLVAIAFAERGASTLSRRMAQFDQLLAANLLDAEIRSVFAREQVVADARMLPALSRVIPDRLLDDQEEFAVWARKAQTAALAPKAPRKKSRPRKA